MPVLIKSQEEKHSVGVEVNPGFQVLVKYIFVYGSCTRKAWCDVFSIGWGSGPRTSTSALHQEEMDGGESSERNTDLLTYTCMLQIFKFPHLSCCMGTILRIATGTRRAILLQ